MYASILSTLLVYVASMVSSSCTIRSIAVNKPFPSPTVCGCKKTHPDLESDLFGESLHLFQVQFDGKVRSAVFPVPE